MNDVTLAPPATSRDNMALDKLDKQTAGAVSVSAVAGGVSFASALEVMEFAKLMAVAEQAVPKHLRRNPGACLAVVFQAVEWRMSPFQVANKSYLVNDRIGYESQLIHAVIEARAPLQRRLDCTYDGEGAERSCTVIGHFINGDDRTYTSPKIKDIKVKNSPLWTADPDQQLWYFASRSWARKWCPDVLMGIYSREELLENSVIGREEEAATEGSGLHARLQGTDRSPSGHTPGHAATELATVAGEGAPIIEGDKVDEATPPSGKGRKKKGDAEPKGDAKGTADASPPTEPATPKTSAEYAAYARKWIAESTDAAVMDKRWNDERALRNNCGVTADDRAPIQEVLIDQRDKLAKKE